MAKTLADSWSTSWEGAEWGPAWKGAFEGLSPQQAAWVPDQIDDETLSVARRERVHSIWQILNHVVFWREAMLGILDGDRPTKEQIAERNWAEPAEVTDAAWEAARTRFAETQRRMGEAIAASEENAQKLAEMLPHDAYHIGQVYTMRALLGV